MAKMYSPFSKAILALIFAFAACDKDTDPAKTVTPPANGEVTTPTPYTIQKPLGFPDPYLSEKNPLTVEGIALGKRLYSDPILSENGLSCTSCHSRERSYSGGVYHAQNGYNMAIMAHVNLAFKPVFNWEGSAPELDLLPMGDFEPEFFNTDSVKLKNRLLQHPEYPQMFKKAFRINNLDTLTFYNLKKTISYSIVQYLRSRVSAKTRYDDYRIYKKKLTAEEMNGMAIFFSEKGDCFHCHPGPMFTDNGFHNTGLNDVFTGFDRGRFLVTGQAKDMGTFIAPTLRNIELTAPYMHDGRFNTLEEVIEFYTSGVKVSATLDPIMTKRMNNRTMELTPTEKKELIAFLKTLTDYSFIEP